MWFMAVACKDYEHAREIWDRVHMLVNDMPLNITACVVQLEGTDIVTVFTEGEEPPSSTQFALRSIFQGLGYVDLPASAKKHLLGVRLKGSIKAHASEDNELIHRYEKHHDSPESAEEINLEEDPEIFKEIELIRSTIEAKYRPFVRAYCIWKGLEEQLYSDIGMSQEIYKGVHAERLIQRIQGMSHYMFTDSGRAMNEAVQDEGTAIEHLQGDMWIEHDKPVTWGFQNDIRAVLITREGDIPMEGPCYGVAVIKQDFQAAIAFMYVAEGNDYFFSEKLDCPTGLCHFYSLEDIEGDIQSFLTSQDFPIKALSENMEMGFMSMCTVCASCFMEAVKFLRAGLKQIHLDYALSSNPDPLKERPISYTEKKLVPRHHGKGKPKEKNVTSSINYTFVDYDVSQRKDPMETTFPGEAQGTRTNWMKLHGKEEVIYERRSFPDLIRHYKGDRYRALIQQVRQGNTVSPSGEEYTLIEEIDGSYTVRGNVRFPNGKYIPMLRPEARKTQVMKRIKASLYEKPSSQG